MCFGLRDAVCLDTTVQNNGMLMDNCSAAALAADVPPDVLPQGPSLRQVGRQVCHESSQRKPDLPCGKSGLGWLTDVRREIHPAVSSG